MDNISNVIGIAFEITGADSTKDGIDSVVRALRRLRDVSKEVAAVEAVRKVMEGMKPGADVSTSIDKVTASLKNLQQTTASLNGTSTDVTVGVKNMTSTIGTFGKMLKTAFAVRLVKTVMDKFIGASAQYTEDMNLFNQSMGSYAKQAYEYGQTVSEVMGIDLGEWSKAQGVFQTLAEGFGVASDRAYIMSKNLTQLSYDIASFYNLDTEEAMKKVQSGLAGEIEPMRRIGYDLSKANMMATAAELGITKTYNAMTQAEKSQLRYYMMMQSVTQVQGDMARTLSAPANMLRVFSAQAQAAARAIGNMFIPALQAILPYAIAVMRVIALVANALAKLFGFKAPEVGGVESIAQGTSDISDNLDEATGRAKALKKQLAGFDEINNLTTNTGSSGSGDLGGGWVDFELPEYDFLGDATPWIDQFVEKIKPIAGIVLGIVAALTAWRLGLAFLTGVPALLGLVSKAFGGVVVAFTKHPILATIALIIGAIVALYTTSDEFRAFVDAIVPGIIDWVKTLWQNIVTFVSGVEEKGGLIAALCEVVATGVVNVFRWVWDNAGDIFNNMVRFIVTVLGNLVAYIGGGFLVGVLHSFATVWSGVKDIFWGFIDFITGVFTLDWEKTWEGLKKIVSGVFKAIAGVISIPFNGAIGAINGVIDAINRMKISIPSWVPFIGGNTYSLNLRKLPYLAEGGVVDRPTLAMIGEQGSEAVVPLENNTGWINALATKINENVSSDESETILSNIYAYMQTMNLSPRITIDDVGKANDKYTDRKLRIQGV